MNGAEKVDFVGLEAEVGRDEYPNTVLNGVLHLHGSFAGRTYTMLTSLRLCPCARDVEMRYCQVLPQSRAEGERREAVRNRKPRLVNGASVPIP